MSISDRKNSVQRTNDTTQNSDTQSRKERNRRIIKRLWIIFGALSGLTLIFFILVYNGIIGYMPPVEELKNPKDRFASVVYTADGIEMGRYFRSTGNRVYADYDEISQHVVDALVATEDARFEDHSGIDLRALFRAIVKTVILRDKSAGGGSTKIGRASCRERVCQYV